MSVQDVRPEDYQEMLAVWESSVRATHDFLTEADIELFKLIIIEQAFPSVALKCYRNKEGAILGFVGVHDSKIEMLFILDRARGKGMGKVLLEYAVNSLGATKVDVNEQNTQAIGFYDKFGFKVVSRSARDGMGKPYPLLHMALTK